jgi:hypothetical protein
VADLTGMLPYRARHKVPGRKRLLAAVVVSGSLAILGLTVPPALAGSPHFVGVPVLTTSGDTATVTAKEAGLGDEPQITVVLSGTAECVNRGGNNPSAANKTSFTQGTDVPVQNGKADYSVSATAVFDPGCAPPMTVEFTSAVLQDVTNGLTVTLAP